MKNKNLKNKFSTLKMESSLEMENLNEALMSQLKGGFALAHNSNTACNSGCANGSCGASSHVEIAIKIKR